MVSRNHRAGTIGLPFTGTGTGTSTSTSTSTGTGTGKGKGKGKGTGTGTGTGKTRGQNQAMQTRDSLVAGDRRKLEIQSDCRQERIAA